jgi:hypothetical protein
MGIEVLTVRSFCSLQEDYLQMPGVGHGQPPGIIRSILSRRAGLFQIFRRMQLGKGASAGKNNIRMLAPGGVLLNRYWIRRSKISGDGELFIEISQNPCTH